MVLFMDELNNLCASGDKFLISAFLGSNFLNCLPAAMSFNYNKDPVLIPLILMCDDSAIDRLSDEKALSEFFTPDLIIQYLQSLLNEQMMTINFGFSNPYDGGRPSCWPPEIPFCNPAPNNEQSLTNRRIGINTPGQAAKVVLRNMEYYYSEVARLILGQEASLRKICL
ncbi:unnamed protein product [Gongylonema pulchrum]|uniref:ATPase_AAA_core domain-containing protein n=1 Tax=Gongylonema pulchrum TaxID=637853 RepID=A0A183EPX5_9BILA|nr:unnamed protein product [Gongylonema pulchrum]